MASTAVVTNVFTENLLGNGFKMISGTLTLATYDQAANPVMNLANYFANAPTQGTFMVVSAKTGYTFDPDFANGAHAGTIKAYEVGNINGVVGPQTQVENGTALASVTTFIAIGKAN
jgi:hypothetical protein